MPRRAAPPILLAAVVIIASGALVFGLHRSLWTAWEMAPPGTTVIALNLTKPGAAVALKAAAIRLPAEAAALASHTARLVYSQQPQGATLIIVPRSLFALRLPPKPASGLAAAGWQLARRGQLIYATREGGAVPASSLAGARAGLRRLLEANTLKSPLALAQITDHPLTSARPIAAVVAVRNTPTGTLLTATVQPAGTRQNDPPALPPAEADLTVHLPGSTLAELPENLQQVWQRVTTQKLGLAEDSAGPLPPFAQMQAVHLVVQQDSAALAVRGNPEQFIQHVSSLLQAEDARRRPVTRSFRLPDGTIGTESIPGPIEPVLDDAADPDGCLIPHAGKINLWLCRQGNIVAISPSRDLARMLSQAASIGSYLTPARAWYVYAGPKYAPLLGLPGVSAVTAEGDDDTQMRVSLLLQE